MDADIKYPEKLRVHSIPVSFVEASLFAHIFSKSRFLMASSVEADSIDWDLKPFNVN